MTDVIIPRGSVKSDWEVELATSSVNAATMSRKIRRCR